MNRRYLEIDSTYRNRTLYPDPASFTVLISQSGTKTKLSAYDPISKSTPLNIFSPTGLSNIIGYISNPTNPIQTLTQFFACFPVSEQVVKTTNYYVGYPIKINTGPIVLITGWDYLNTDPSTDCFFVTVTPGLINIPVGLDTVNFQSGSTDLSTATIFIPGGISADSYYNNFIIWNQTKNNFRQIVSYNGQTKIATLDISPPLGPVDTPIWDISDILVLRSVPPQEIGTFESTGTSNTVTLPPNSSNIVDYYTGDFIRFTSGPNNNRISRIINYTGIGQIAQTGPPQLPFIPPHVASLDSNINLNILGNNYEILNFTKDNANPLVYTGSLVSQQEMACYEIKLVNLVLPNSILTTGGRIAFYPYVYVELQNVSSAGAGTKHTIYSNNPNSTRMLFRAAISDISNPLSSPFIKIDADGMVQTIKFQPNDSFKFAVYLTNGNMFETVLKDNVSPLEPNILVQISALFELKRV